MIQNKYLRRHLKKLEKHLSNENPLLLGAVKAYRQLDRVAYKLGLLNPNQSYATGVRWWPVVSVFGSGSQLKHKVLKEFFDLETTSNQSLNEVQYQVYCHTHQTNKPSLPSIALDCDPRFPFYKISKLNSLSNHSQVTQTHFTNIKDCLHLQTTTSDRLKGLLCIVNPDDGLDVSSDNLLTQTIIEQSDLVIVCRSDEDINHEAESENSWDEIVALESNQQNNRQGQNKFLEVTSTSLDQNISIDFKVKQIYINRLYGVLNHLEELSNDIESTTVPKIRALIGSWERGTIWRDCIAFSLLTAVGYFTLILSGLFENANKKAQWLTSWIESAEYDVWLSVGAISAAFLLLLLTHLMMRRMSMRAVISDLEYSCKPEEEESLRLALRKNSTIFHSIFRPEIVGWNSFSKRRLKILRNNISEMIKQFNDRYVST